jgi:thiamine biosynthesis lipoprotein
VLALAVAAGAVAANHGAAPSPGPATIERQLHLMGTRLTICVDALDAAAASAGAEAAVAALETAEARLSTWRQDSELSRLNAAPAGAPVSLSTALADELREALRCAEATGGAFDPAVGGLVDSWDLRGRGRVPTTAALAAALTGAGASSVAIDGRLAVRHHAATRLEEGAWGKGAGLDAALAALQATPRVIAAWLDLGGQAAVLGDAAWTATLADPDDRQRAVAAIELAGGSLSTSGNGERGLLVEGRRIGHLLDPRSGRPVPDFGSLTVWARSGLRADCLSTGLYVMGPDTALAWAAANPEIETIVVERRPGGGLRLRASAGLAGRVRPLVPGLVMTFDEGPRRPSRALRSTPRSAKAARKNEGAVDRFAWQRGSTAP